MKLTHLISFTEILAEDELDERALEALKELDETSSIGVLKQFAESDLSHVNNKSAFLCGVIKAYRQKSRMKQGTGTPASAETKGPDEAKIKVSSITFTAQFWLILLVGVHNKPR